MAQAIELVHCAISTSCASLTCVQPVVLQSHLMIGFLLFIASCRSQPLAPLADIEVSSDAEFHPYTVFTQANPVHNTVDAATSSTSAHGTLSFAEECCTTTESDHSPRLQRQQLPLPSRKQAPHNKEVERGPKVDIMPLFPQDSSPPSSPKKRSRSIISPEPPATIPKRPRHTAASIAASTSRHSSAAPLRAPPVQPGRSASTSASAMPTIGPSARSHGRGALSVHPVIHPIDDGNASDNEDEYSAFNG